MSFVDLKIIGSIRTSKFLLLGVLAGLVVIHLTLVHRVGRLPSWSHGTSVSLLSNSALLWFGSGLLLWSKQRLVFQSKYLSPKVVGGLLVAGLLFTSIWFSDNELFLRSFPTLGFFGVALIAGGFSKIQQFWRELLILSFLIPSQNAIEILAVRSNLPTLTAYFATALLWCFGFDVRYENSQVLLPPHNGVSISPECAGVGSMIHLLGLATLYLLLFPTRPIHRFLLPFVTLGIAFVNNGVRVATLAVISGYASSQTFEYWHTGSGSHVNSVVSVVLLGVTCWLLQRRIEHDR